MRDFEYGVLSAFQKSLSTAHAAVALCLCFIARRYTMCPRGYLQVREGTGTRLYIRDEMTVNAPGGFVLINVRGEETDVFDEEFHLATALWNDVICHGRRKEAVHG